DIHIMAYRPEQYFDRMDIGNDDIVAVHYEACENLHEVIADIRLRGANPFVVISPETKPDVLKDYLDEIDGILVMTVYPGFAGQPIVEGSFDKIKEVRKLIDESGKNIVLEVDGHVSWDLCQKMRECGADLFVAGSSSVYSKGIELDEAVHRMMKLIN
ncbi:MAG: ribulose-phosphate 3-epimerase, partial [Ruminococcus sp.]|nr:ribulose-phosphate 3-epimerase [Ruminococcus sp.]